MKLYNLLILILALFICSCMNEVSFEENKTENITFYILADSTVSSVTISDTVIVPNENNVCYLHLKENITTEIFSIKLYDKDNTVLEDYHCNISYYDDKSLHYLVDFRKDRSQWLRSNLDSKNLLKDWASENGDTIIFDYYGLVNKINNSDSGSWYLSGKKLKILWNDITESQILKSYYDEYFYINFQYIDGIKELQNIYTIAPVPAIQLETSALSSDTIFLQWEVSEWKDYYTPDSFYIYWDTITQTDTTISNKEFIEDASSFIIDSLKENGIYWTQIYLKNNKKCAISEIAVCTTSNDTPPAVTFSISKITDQSIEISFSQLEIPDFSSYVVCYEEGNEYKLNSYNKKISDWTNKIYIDKIDSTDIKLSNLKESQVYFVNIYTLDSRNIESGAIEQKVTTKSEDYDRLIFSGTLIKPDTIKHEWNKYIGELEFLAYEIRYAKESDEVKENDSLAWFSNSINDTTAVVTGIPHQINQYRFRVFLLTTDSTGVGSNSLINYKIILNSPITSSGQAYLSWKSIYSYAYFDIYRKLEGDSTYANIAKIDGSKTSWFDRTVTKNCKYAIVANTSNNSGNERYVSNTVEAKFE